jgi:hypothetical protein
MHQQAIVGTPVLSEEEEIAAAGDPSYLYQPLLSAM